MKIDFLEIKTIVFSDIVSSAACALAMVFLWQYNHRRYSGVGLWLVSSVVQFAALLLVTLRGFIPDVASILGGNALLLGGIILLYRGLRRFLGMQEARFGNIALLCCFMAAHAYFTFLDPSLKARSVNISLGMLVLCAQCAWITLRSVDDSMRAVTRTSGLIFVGFCLISAARIAIELASPAREEFLETGAFNALAILLYQMLVVVLTFSQFLMVNRRLFMEQTHEIAERKRAEELAAASLRDKEVLLRELYHRTKNNMQVISSMLSLEAGRSGDEEHARVLREMDGRITSMALVHEKLYLSNNLSSLDLGDYLHELARLMKRTHDRSQDRVSLVFELQSVHVLIDSAIPVGLIVSEMLSNAYKYAFPGERTGEIRIRLSMDESGMILLGISDNGPGFPSGIEPARATTLGMQIIHGIASHQLGATVECASDGGVAWSIRFPGNRTVPRLGNTRLEPGPATL